MFSEHADQSDNDKRNRENLSHVDRQGFLETLLYLFGVLDEEAESEDVRQAEAKIPACAYYWHLAVSFWLLALLIDSPHDNE